MITIQAESKPKKLQAKFYAFQVPQIMLKRDVMSLIFAIRVGYDKANYPTSEKQPHNVARQRLAVISCNAFFFFIVEKLSELFSSSINYLNFFSALLNYLNFFVVPSDPPGDDSK